MPDPSSTGIILRKTAGGAGWTIGWRAATRAVGLLSTLVLARVLVPADFGLVALAMSFARAVDVLADLGVQEALIREPAPDRAMYDTAFTINVCRGLITAAVIALSAAPFAAVYGDRRLSLVVLALAGAVVCDALENVGVADFRRQLAFHREFQLSILPRLIQAVLTIVLALVWQSYWALVAGILTSHALLLVSSYLMHRSGHAFRCRPGTGSSGFRSGRG